MKTRLLWLPFASLTLFSIAIVVTWPGTTDGWILGEVVSYLGCGLTVPIFSRQSLRRGYVALIAATALLAATIVTILLINDPRWLSLV